MAITTFVRKEKKYLITSEQRDELLKVLPKYMVFDKFCQNGNMYTVNNVYFDTDTFNVIRNSISKPAYKSKLRIRTYVTDAKDDDVAFLEMKKKVMGVVNKRMKWNDCTQGVPQGAILSPLLANLYLTTLLSRKSG